MDDVEWNVINEGQLLDIMAGHKPVGVNKNFQMLIICEKLGEFLSKDVKPVIVWTHLEAMYNLEALDEIESLPFPNDEMDFILPDVEFGDLLSKKEDDKKSILKGKETPKSMKDTKKEEKQINRNIKDIQRRDSKDKTTLGVKKEVKRELEKTKPAKGRSSLSILKDESKPNRSGKNEEIFRSSSKRPTRGSHRSEDGYNSGKASPISPIPTGIKRRRLNSDVGGQNS